MMPQCRVERRAREALEEVGVYSPVVEEALLAAFAKLCAKYPVGEAYVEYPLLTSWTPDAKYIALWLVHVVTSGHAVEEVRQEVERALWPLSQVWRLKYHVKYYPNDVAHLDVYAVFPVGV